MWSDDIIIVFGLVRYAFFDDTCSRWWYWNIGQDIQYTMNIHYKSTLLLNARSSNNQAITISNLYLRNIYFRFDDFCWEIAWNRNLNVCTICLAFATKFFSQKQLQPIQAINNVPQCPRFPRSSEHHHPCRSIGVLLCNEFIIASSTRQCHYGMVVDWIDRFHVHPFANHHHQPHHRRR